MTNQFEKELEGLTEAEKEAALKILNELAASGQSELLEKYKYADYDEIPVDIHTFLHDKKYLGNGLTDPEGRFTIFKYWEEKLNEIFPTNTTTAYNTLILTGCLSYDTQIPLLNGKVVNIGELAEQNKIDEYVYSYDTALNQYVPGHLVDAFCTGEKPVYEITLDNGTVITATSNHKFMTRDKHWKSIDSGLSVGDSMMPFNRDTQAIANREGYEVIKNPNKDGTYTDMFTHRLVMQYKMGDYKGVVHHGDFNKRNNDPRNLVLTTWENHKMYHARRGGEHFAEFNKKRKLGLIPKETEQAILKGGLKGNKNRWADPLEHSKMSKLTTERMLNGFAKTMSDVVWHGENAARNKQIVINNIVTANKNNINQYQISKAVKISNLALLNYGELTESTYEKIKIDYNMRSGYPSFKSILKRITYNDLLDQAKNYNHKIVDIKFKGYEKVYDLTVEKYHNFAIDNGIVAHNSIGIGKSTAAVVCLLYMLYRLLCLKDPYLFYGLQPIDKISISLMNITIENAKGVALDKMNQLILSSEWFMNHGEMRGTSNLEFVPSKHIEIIAASSNNQVIGRALFANFTDEVNFGLTNDVEKLKKKQKQLISQVDARMKSRFMRGTYLPTMNIIASSKNSDQSFLDDYINTKKKNESKTTLIVDEPQWVVDSRKDSKEHFWVAVGNKFLSNELLPKNASKLLVDEYRAKGYSMLEVPIGYWENFQDNIDGALTDIAGIATASSLKYISGMRWNEIKDDRFENPFTKEIITVGNAKDDLVQYNEFFDLSKIPTNLKSRPMYIHLDMSMSGDKTGIAGIWITGKRPKVEGESASRELYYQVAFSVSIKAPKGAEISFDKHRTFIRWLKEQGFAIKGISSDTFQSAQIQQQLTADGFNVSVISVDRLDHDTKTQLQYAYLKSTIYERRLTVYKNCDFLTEEVLGLERLSDGHIEHPNAGKSGSKDAIDAVCGALWNASLHADEYAFEYGEELDAAISASMSGQEYNKQQVTLDFEEELKKISDPLYGKVNDTNDPFMNFGMGKAQPMSQAYYLPQGIVVF